MTKRQGKGRTHSLYGGPAEPPFRGEPRNFSPAVCTSPLLFFSRIRRSRPFLFPPLRLASPLTPSLSGNLIGPTQRAPTFLRLWANPSPPTVCMASTPTTLGLVTQVRGMYVRTYVRTTTNHSFVEVFAKYKQLLSSNVRPQQSKVTGLEPFFT